MSDSLAAQLDDLKHRLSSLPKATEPPPTTLEIIRNYQQEQDWQRLLVFFLTPGEAHGLDTDLLEHLLDNFSSRGDLDFNYSRFDLQDVQVEQEVTLSNGGIPDAVVWSSEDWFICFELKVSAPEGYDQTQSYVDAQSFETIDLDKAGVSSDGHHYIYLAPDDSPPPGATEFVPVSWEWTATLIRSFLEKSHGAYPARTTAQLDDFADTIQSEVSMTDFQENQHEKAELYFEYYDEIAEVKDAFDEQWENFASSWGTQLAQALESAEIVELQSQRDDHVMVEFKGASGVSERWVFRQGNSDWAGISLDRWRRDKDDPSRIYPDTDSSVSLTLYHRLELNRELAVRDQILELTLWHGSDNSDQFMETFNDTLATKKQETDTPFPPAVNLTGGSGSVFEATYDVPVRAHDDFFDAYIAALREAFLNLLVENTSLFTAIDETFEESLEI